MRLGLQLYTLREQTGTRDGLRAALEKAREIGYEGVQLSAVGCMNGDPPEVTASEARVMLDEFGLDCCATHRPWERFDDHLEEEIEFHRALGCRYAAIGVPPVWAREQGAAGWERLADAMSLASVRLGQEGILLGYHNHALEFERLLPSSLERSANEEGPGEEKTPIRPFDILIQDSLDLFFILDTYWVVHAGIELIPLIERLSGRLPVVHLKDRAVFGWEVDFAPVGEGNLDWDRILPAFEAAGTEWLVVEQDTCRRDVWDCVESSVRFLKGKV